MLQFETPSSVLLAGPSQSGKTVWTRRLIQNKAQMFKVPPVKVIYAYSAWQPLFDSLEGVDFHKDAPTGAELEQWSESGEHILVVLDDVMAAVCASPDIMSLFTINCHHRNISVLFLVQNIFPTGKWARSISLNCHYIVLFRTKRDVLQIQSLGKQILPGQSKYFAGAYGDATEEKWGYLLCDLHPATEKEFQLRTHIFPEEVIWFYTPLKKDTTEMKRVFTVPSSER